MSSRTYHGHPAPKNLEDAYTLPPEFPAGLDALVEFLDFLYKAPQERQEKCCGDEPCGVAFTLTF